MDKALKAIEIFANIPIALIEVGLTTSLEIANELKIYAYDAYFLRCATMNNASLLSLDRRLNDLANQLSITVLEI